MRSLYPALALLLVLIALLYLTAEYFPNGPGKPVVNTGWQPHPLPPPDPKEPVKAGYAKGEITNACEQAFRNANASFDAIAQTPEKDRSIDNTLLKFEETMGDYYDATAPLSLMGYVHPDKDIAAEGSACEEKEGVFTVNTYSRRDLYDAIRTGTPRNADEARLLNRTVRLFERNGLALPDDRLAVVRQNKAELATLETRFLANLNNDNTTLEFSAGELAGVPPEALSTFTKTASGTYLVTTKYPDFAAVMMNAENASTRRTISIAYANRQAAPNTKLLEDAIVLREKIAQELGYKTWADYRIDGRMAGSLENVENFLGQLRAPLEQKTRGEFATLLAIKQQRDPAATGINAWDIAYLNEQLRKQKYLLDDEAIRPYFPLDPTLTKIFALYEGPLGIRFNEVKDAKVWADGVKLYRIDNATTGSTIAYLYLDLHPREGKVNGGQMYTITGGRAGPGSTYSVPVVAILANFRGPDGSKPSLLSHDDVVTLFHELGHTFQATLTRAPYATLSGSNVEWDFVEAPSQALEEWAWQPQVLDEISGLWTDPAKKLPADLRDRMIAARDMDAGYSYTRQLMYADEDMAFHTAPGPVDVTNVSNSLYRELIGIPPTPGSHEPATIEHFMGGYDAGYYSYLWSEVYALDIFAKFKEDGLTSPATGLEYRHWILEQGNMQDGDVLLKGFLKKEPTTAAFYERLNITVPAGNGSR
jgi:thimet oligopeptidase